MSTTNASSIAVLYQDEYLLAVDKPAGTIVHADGTGTHTLSDSVRSMLIEHDETQAAHELQAVNRLDRETTGIVLFSLSKESQPVFDALVSAHDTQKRYLAICCGIPTWKTTLIDTPIARDRHDGRRMRTGPSGKPAQTSVTVLQTRKRTSTAPDLALLDIQLLSGRKHQIRVHLSSQGLPLLGDILYGRPVRAGASGKPYPLMLHAFRMEFEHPVTGEHVLIQTPIPARFKKLFPGIEPQGHLNR